MFIFKFGSDLSSILSEFTDSVPFWIDRIELGAFCSFFFNVSITKVRIWKPNGDCFGHWTEKELTSGAKLI